MTRKATIALVALMLIASMLACSLPGGGSSAPEATPAPTESGFAAPTQEGAPQASEAAAPAGEPAQPGAAASEQPAGNKLSDKELTIAVTASLAETDLFKQIISDFMNRTGYQVKIEAGAPGRGFRLAEKFVVDVLLVNDPGSEKDFITKGLGKDRIAVFHTDYIILGPTEDPAKVKGSPNAAEALKKIATAQAKFITRGDETPVSVLEARLWKQIGITPAGDWFIKSEEGNKGVIKIAADRKAYILAPRELYLDVKSKTPDLKLEVLLEGDPALLDAYHIVTTNPDKSPKVNYTGAQAFIQYLQSPDVQALIAAYGTQQYGAPVFFLDK